MNNFFKADFNLPSFSSIDNDGSSNNNNNNNNNNNSNINSNNNNQNSHNNVGSGSNTNSTSSNPNLNSNNNQNNFSSGANSNNYNFGNNSSSNNNSNNANNSFNNNNFNNSNHFGNNNANTNSNNNFNYNPNPNTNNNSFNYSNNQNNNANSSFNGGFNNNNNNSGNQTNNSFNANNGNNGGNNFNTFGNNNNSGYNANYNPNSSESGYNGNGNNNNYNYNYGNGNNTNNNSNNTTNNSSIAGMTFRSQQGMLSPSDYGQQQQQQQQFPPYPFQSTQNQQYQQHPQQPYPQQQQQQQHPYGSSDNYRSFMSSDMYGNSNNSYPMYRPDNMSQEGPIRSQPRGMPLDNGHSVRFNPSRNYGIEATETSTSSGTSTGTFLARPKIPGLPCIACNMSRMTCDGGSPCRNCHQNRVRCHYEGDNNTRFFEIEALQFDEPLSGSQHSSGSRDNRDNPDNRDGRAPPAQAGFSALPTSSPSFTASSPSTGNLSRNPNSRSRSRSGSGSVGSGSGSAASLNARKSQDLGYTRVSPVISSPIMLSDQSLISIPPFQEVHQDRSQHNQHNRVTLPSISAMGSTIVPLSSATNTRTPSSTKPASGYSASPRSQSSSSSSGRDSVSGPGASSTKAGHDRSNLTGQSASSVRAQTDRTDSEIVKRALSKKQQQHQNQLQQKLQQSQQQQQQHQQAMPPKDPLYSLSSASIRARKNALEMENIQRASHVYADYIAKIKDLSVSIVDATTKATPTYLSERDMMPYNRMDVDAETRTVIEHTSTTSSSRDNSSNLGESTVNPLEGLQRLGRSGLLHGLVQQYFTLIHPQFMVLHKNRFLVRFWAQFGSFPEANELQSQVIQNAKATNIWRGPVDSGSGKDEQERSGMQTVCPLLLLAMLALVSRHINDRSLFKSTAADKQQRVEHSLALLSREFQDSMNFMLSSDKAQEARLYELMEPDMQHQGPSGESLEDRGEQYFQWASELLKAKYEEPSLTVVQSLLLLREYAIMAGNHTQAYMYGGTAITMAMGLGWHHAGPTKSPGQGDQPSTAEFDDALDNSGETGAEGEESKELKATDEEQRLCWWHCFIVDRWMSAIHNRPVNIPIHIFDKTLLPLPKTIRTWDSKENDGPQTPLSVFSSSNFTDSRQSSPEVLSAHAMKIPNRDPLSIGSGVATRSSPYLPSPHYRAKAFFDQQCRQALLLDDILSFLSSWSDDLFVSSVEFEKLSQSLDDWHQALAEWQTFPISGIVGPGLAKRQQSQGQRRSNAVDEDGMGALTSTINADESRDVVQATLLGMSYHTIRILLYRPFLRTNLRHPPCLPSRASAACAQSANAMTSLAEYLMNQTDTTVQPCLLMRHQFPLVTAAGIQQMNSNLDEEPRLSTPAKINLLKTIRILRDADRSSWAAGVQDGLLQVLRELFPTQMKQMWATA